MRLFVPILLLHLLLVLVTGKEHVSNHASGAGAGAGAAGTSTVSPAVTEAPIGEEASTEPVLDAEGETTANVTATVETSPPTEAEIAEPTSGTAGEITPAGGGNETETIAPTTKAPAAVWDPTGTLPESTTKPETEAPTKDEILNEEGGNDDGHGTDDMAAEEEEVEEEEAEEWNQEEEEKPKVPYIPPSGEDPFDKPVDESEWAKANQWPQESPEQMMHDKNVIIAVSVAVVFGMVLAVFSAQQVIENPDGFCASLCRCSVKIFCCFFKILCFPCRMCCGNKDRRTHDLMMGDNDSYTHDLELT